MRNSNLHFGAVYFEDTSIKLVWIQKPMSCEENVTQIKACLTEALNTKKQENVSQGHTFEEFAKGFQ